MRINPNGTVPALRIGTGEASTVLTDSMDIVHWARQHSQSEAAAERLSAPDGSVAERWVQRYQALPIRVISYGKIGGPARLMNRWRRSALRHHQARVKDPGLKAAYRDKLADIENFMKAHVDPVVVSQETDRLNTLLDDLDTVLMRNPFIAGDDYTLADLVWTVRVARLYMLGFTPLETRPGLTRWYDAIRQRPSFEQADIWERFKPRKAIPILARKILSKLKFWS